MTPDYPGGNVRLTAHLIIFGAAERLRPCLRKCRRGFCGYPSTRHVEAGVKRLGTAIGPLSQRDFASKPKVASLRATLGKRSPVFFFQPRRGCAIIGLVSRLHATNPLGLKNQFCAMTQRSPGGPGQRWALSHCPAGANKSRAPAAWLMHE